jgi:hypothetical protein
MLIEVRFYTTGNNISVYNIYNEQKLFFEEYTHQLISSFVYTCKKASGTSKLKTTSLKPNGNWLCKITITLSYQQMNTD